MLYVMLPPPWLRDSEGAKPIQKECSFEEALEYNGQGYNIYFYPNHPSPAAFAARKAAFVQAADIDTWNEVFLDMDLKSGVWKSKEEFLEVLLSSEILPSRVVDSGGGVHSFWRVTDLDAMSFLRLSRRLARKYRTDEAVTMIKQLMRVPGTVNTKDPENLRECEELYRSDDTYTCEQLDKWLPPITAADEDFCKRHYDMAYNPEAKEVKVSEKLPLKFKKLLAESREAKELFAGDTGDRSKADYRLALLMVANGFTREEGMSVLVNCSKALERSPAHRLGYAENLADKVWAAPSESEQAPELSNSVADILKRGNVIKGKRFPCWEVFDGTDHGFHLTEVLGLIGGSGAGKTMLAMNFFYHFARLNPEYVHMFVSLEQPVEEIALRWQSVTQGNEALNDKVHVLGNYEADGSYRHLSLTEIKDYILAFEKKTGKKVGCCVVDHIGVLRKANKNGENEGLMDVMSQMKAFAKATNTFLIMQSQTSRAKAGIGDQELDKDAAYGSTLFEWFVDYIITMWAPLKRVYAQMPDMTCAAFKFCKLRKKNVKKDRIKEDVVHVLKFDPDTERLRLMTQEEEEQYEFWNTTALKLINKDRKREPTRVTKIDWAKSGSDEQESA